MAKEQEQQTMEEYLLSQLDTPVVLKDGTMMTKPDGSPMTAGSSTTMATPNVPPSSSATCCTTGSRCCSGRSDNFIY